MSKQFYSAYTAEESNEGASTGSPQQPSVYKYGTNNLNLDEFINTLNSNFSKYVEEQNWNSQQRQEFENSFNKYIEALRNGRLESSRLGVITDAGKDGVYLSDIDVDYNNDGTSGNYYYNDNGEQIDQQAYDALKRRKQKKYNTFNANQAVASYFKTIGDAMINTPPVDNSFDINKHGFTSYWTNKYNPGGGEFDATSILDKDVYDETTKTRANTNRKDLLKNELTLILFLFFLSFLCTILSLYSLCYFVKIACPRRR